MGGAAVSPSTGIALTADGRFPPGSGLHTVEQRSDAPRRMNW